jgi:hypothetical protein
MITQYEIEHVLLAKDYSKARKLLKLEAITNINDAVKEKMKAIILNGESFETVMSRMESDDRIHWITSLGKKAAADLLTLGKVQPETMLEMSSLPEADFKEVVRIATSTARKLNEITIEAERDLSVNTIHNSVV